MPSLQPHWAIQQLQQTTDENRHQQYEEIPKEEEDQPVQAKKQTGQSLSVSPSVETQLAASRGQGSQLAPETQTFMESRFGQDFSEVRVHADGQSAQLNRALRAQAFTHGQDVYFGAGRYSPESGDGRRLLAHELTHVVQQDVSEVSQPKVRRQLLDTSKTAPNLNDESLWFPDQFKRSEKEALDANLLSPRPTDVPDVRSILNKTEEEEVETVSFEISTTASGKKGSIVSATKISVIFSPQDSFLIPTVEPVSELPGTRKASTYPIQILYGRTIIYSDSDSRSCQFEMKGNVFFTHKQWAEQLGAREPSFESLQELMGDTGSLTVEMRGISSIPNLEYFMHSRVTGNSLNLQQYEATRLPITHSVSHPGGIASAHAGITSVPADFILLDASAGEQFISLQRFLFAADIYEIERRRLREFLKRIRSSDSSDNDDGESWLESAISWFGNPISEAWNAIPAPVRGVLKAVGKAAVGIAVVIGTAALIVALAPVELAVGTVALVLGGALLLEQFVVSLFGRGKEAELTGEGSTLDVIGAALGDVSGVSGIYEARTDKSILSDVPLNRSEEERWEGGTMGAIQIVATFFGIRSSIKRTPTSPSSEPITAATQADPVATAAHNYASRFKPITAATQADPVATAAHNYASRFNGRLINDEGLQGIFARTRNQPTLSVDRRAAAFELQIINDLLTNGYNGQQVTQLRVLRPTTSHRTPDLGLTLAEVTTTRVEICAFTAAPRAHSDPHAPLAVATRARSTAITKSQLKAAIMSKARTTPERPSQLDVPIPGIAPQGRIAIGSMHRTLSLQTADAAVSSLAPRLGNHVRSISFTFRDSSTGVRRTLVYNRQGQNFVR